ncbi:MAG: hypothetical protein IKN71_02620 [Alphaproteobacteria bacterium]|nr:hypothetical protein [Alphaproteobacteria bacterium]
MAKLDLNNEAEVKKVIADLRDYRLGWEREIREKWSVQGYDAKQIRYGLYQLSATLILALEDRLAGRGGDKLVLTEPKEDLLLLTCSDAFKWYDRRGREGLSKVVSDTTKHHIRVMQECFKALVE